MKNPTRWISISLVLLVVVGTWMLCIPAAEAQRKTASNSTSKPAAVSTSGPVGKPSLKVMGVSVEKTDPDDQFYYPRSLSGVQVRFRYEGPKGIAIIGFNENASVVTRIVDSAGKDLSKEEFKARNRRSHRKLGFNPIRSPKMAENVKYYFLSAPGIPTTGAASITVAGKLMLQVASGTQEVAVKDISLKVGSVLKFPKGTMTIKKTGVLRDALNLKLEFKGEYLIKKLSFRDAAGKEIKAYGRLYNTSKKEGEIISIFNYQVVNSPKVVNIKLTYYDGIKDVPVPVNAKVTLGL